MKILNRCLTAAGLALLVVSASAQDPNYSAQAAFLPSPGKKNPWISVLPPKLSDVSSKPWLYPQYLEGRGHAEVAKTHWRTLNPAKYNSKLAARGVDIPEWRNLTRHEAVWETTRLESTL